MRILYAEDNVVFQTLLTNTLVTWGFQVDMTGDGADALRRLAEPDGPRLAILDWSMPTMDGTEICRRIRANKQDKYIYIILLTAHGERGDLIEGMKAGADDYLIKPIDLEKLQVRLRAAVRVLDFEERSRSLFEEAPVAYSESDRDGTIVRVNLAQCNLLGYPAHELVGKPIWDLVAPQHRAERQSSVLAELQGDALSPATELPHVARDGSVLTLQLHENRIFDEHGRVVGMRSAMLNVTDRIQQEQERARHTAELARSNAELEQFAYVASHDLQEPLRMVASYTQLLARKYKGKLDRDADDFINFAVDGAQRMQVLIGDLLAYSRVGTRREPPQAIQADSALKTALGNLAMSIQESGVMIHSEPLPVVIVDRQQLTQVFQNLIGNAIKFRNGNAPSVHIGAVRDGAFCRFSVCDNGIGIESAYTERIFQIFQRLHTKAQYAGTGIGLAICKKIVERHGGRIWVESLPAQGSSFHFTIPLGEQPPV